MNARELLREQSAQPPPPEVAALAAAVRTKFGTAVAAIVFYGSCRRGVDLRSGVVDLYAVVDDRRSVERGWRAWLGGLLPPNVYYLETQFEGAPVRAKVALFTVRELLRASRGLESYVWGRLAQPVSLVFARDGQLREQVIGMLEACVQTFLANALPLVAGVTPAAAWRNGLARSYATELRAEGGGRADDIVGPDAAYYELLTRACRPQALVRAADGAWLTRPDPSAARVAWLWRLRLPVGKLASVLRLIKGLYTFDGGLDYIAWKLSRHAGRPIDIPERVRRWPLIFIWGLMLRLYRQGVFR